LRFQASRHYLTAGVIAAVLGLISVWIGLRWMPALLPAGLLFLSALGMFFLASRPSIEIHESHLKSGKLVVPWSQIRRVDRTGWVSPLAVNFTLLDDRKVLLVYPGDLESSNSLLRHIRRHAKEALIDGIPYRQFWGEVLTPPVQEQRQLPSPRYQLLRPDDEAEVERMFQRLKAVGHLDPKKNDE
jgi:hypothetical protein